MAVERRLAPRVCVPGMRVVCEVAGGARLEADVLDVGRGGLFIRTATPLPIGKRLSLEVGAVSGFAGWSALGRVVWTRETGALHAPPGMGITLIDVDDAVLAEVDRLVASRGQKAPDVHGMPTREVEIPRMVLDLASRPESRVSRSTSRPTTDLVSRRPTPQLEDDRTSFAEPPTSEAVPRRYRVGWFLLLLAVAAAAVLYVERRNVPWLQALVDEAPATSAAPAQAASAVPGVPAGPSATTTPTSSAAVAPVVAIPIVSARVPSDAPSSSHPRAAAPAAPRSTESDNPY